MNQSPPSFVYLNIFSSSIKESLDVLELELKCFQSFEDKWVPNVHFLVLFDPESQRCSRSIVLVQEDREQNQRFSAKGRLQTRPKVKHTPRVGSLCRRPFCVPSTH